MKFQLLQNLGLADAKHCNAACGCSLSVDEASLVRGSTIDLTDSAAQWLKNVRGYSALLAPAGSVKGEAKKPELTAPAK